MIAANPTNFTEFWDFYVSQHMDATCRKLHFIGTAGALGCLAVAPLNPLSLLAAPVFGYGFAWFAHFTFEKNRPATFTYPGWSLAADFVMFKKMLLGQMNGEVQRVKELLGQAESLAATS